MGLGFCKGSIRVWAAEYLFVGLGFRVSGLQGFGVGHGWESFRVMLSPPSPRLGRSGALNLKDGD